MKKAIIMAALFAVLGTLAVSCHKEPLVDPSSVETPTGKVYNVVYSVDGVSFCDTLHGQEEWNSFMFRLVSLAKEGHRVTFRDGNTLVSVVSPKETITYVTKNEQEVVNWSTNMFNNGYEVTIIYNEETEEFTCIAIKFTGPSEPTYDTLPNSEWWESHFYHEIMHDSVYILLNISWQDGLLNTYTNMYQHPQCFINDSVMSFEMVGDTLFYDDAPRPLGWLVTFTSDTTMTWKVNSIIRPGFTAGYNIFYFNKSQL